MDNPHAPTRPRTPLHHPSPLTDSIAACEADPIKKCFLTGAYRRGTGDLVALSLSELHRPYTVAQAQSERYLHVEEIAPGLLIGIMPLFATVAIVAPLYTWGYVERWCYHDLNAAWGALKDWQRAGFDTEPQGWHRHLPTNRRRDPDGTEIILP